MRTRATRAKNLPNDLVGRIKVDLRLVRRIPESREALQEFGGERLRTLLSGDVAGVLHKVVLKINDEKKKNI